MSVGLQVGPTPSLQFYNCLTDNSAELTSYVKNTFSDLSNVHHLLPSLRYIIGIQPRGSKPVRRSHANERCFLRNTQIHPAIVSTNISKASKKVIAPVPFTRNGTIIGGNMAHTKGSAPLAEPLTNDITSKPIT